MLKRLREFIKLLRDVLASFHELTIQHAAVAESIRASSARFEEQFAAMHRTMSAVEKSLRYLEAAERECRARLGQRVEF